MCASPIPIPARSALRAPAFGWVVAVWVVLSPAIGRGAAVEVDFNREVLPILSDNCFACHGPDEKQRKAKLRLDLADGLGKVDASGMAVVVPGDPDKSLLVQRVVTADEDDLMPPPKSGRKLTPAQIEVLRRWVQGGGEYVKHWAYVPPERPELPEVRARKWPRNDIDRFVLARLEREKVKPAPEADRPTLARRAGLDLTGLPPTPQEVDAFLADKTEGAYERLVDRLLASPRYGEQMARYWMDASRYADSHGYHIDSERHMWAWRDWVIDAFNRNLAFDAFTREQLAGDLLPEATVEQKVASGFVRANMTTGEGGAIDEEYLAKYTFDRTETTSTIWMGLTMNCARCHTHKYDPISQREYYGLYAFFNNLDEPIMDGNRPNPDPFLRLPTPQQSARLDLLRGQVERAEQAMEAPDPALDPAQDAWAMAQRTRLQAARMVFRPETVCSTNPTQFEVRTDGSVLVSGAAPAKDVYTLEMPAPAGRVLALQLEALPDPSLPGRAAGLAADGSYRVSGLEVDVLTASGDGATPAEPRRLKFSRAYASAWHGDQEPGRAVDDNAESAWALDAAAAGRPQSALFVLEEPTVLAPESRLRVRLRFEAAAEPHALGCFRLSGLGGDLAAAVFNPPKTPPWKLLGPFQTSDPFSGLAAVYGPEAEEDLGKTYAGVKGEIRWSDRGDLEDGRRHLLVNALHGVHGVYYLRREFPLAEAREVTFSVRADELFKFWVDGRLVGSRETKARPGEGPLRVTVPLDAGKHVLQLKVANLQGDCHFAFHHDVETLEQPPPEVAAALLVSDPLEGRSLKTVRVHYRRIAAKDYRERWEQLGLWKEERQDLDAAVVTTMVAKERTEPRETKLLMRGEYDKPGERVTPSVPAILPALPAEAPTNRLGLAQWLLQPEHPLTARVTVNRFWQQYFGVGLVKTAEDFGIQGERPSHPDLLDWLATEFVRRGWDVKGLQRLIVTSATYRQSSAWRPELASKDPENRLLARGPRFRVDAEVVRDTALAVSGLLVEQQGGRSVRPYEPPGLWEAVSFNNSQKYVQDRGEGNYRRSLYTHWKRQSPPPNMLLFDAPTRETCVVRRPRTNTPLQALALLNDPQFVEAARAFAWRILRDGGGNDRSRLAYGFRLATGRNPRRDELRILERALAAQLAEYRADAASAQLALGVGGFQAGAGVEPADLAAWASIAGLLLNLDETVTKS